VSTNNEPRNDGNDSGNGGVIYFLVDVGHVSATTAVRRLRDRGADAHCFSVHALFLLWPVRVGIPTDGPEQRRMSDIPPAERHVFERVHVINNIAIGIKSGHFYLETPEAHSTTAIVQTKLCDTSHM